MKDKTTVLFFVWCIVLVISVISFVDTILSRHKINDIVDQSELVLDFYKLYNDIDVSTREIQIKLDGQFSQNKIYRVMPITYNGDTVFVFIAEETNP